MPARFYDTSAFVKHYHREPGSATVDALISDPDPNLVALLGVVEFHSALVKKVRIGGLQPAAVGQALARLRIDTAAGRFDVREVTQSHHAEAARLLLAYGYTHPLRTLDALQLAVAAGLRTTIPRLEVVSADQTVLAVAAAEGFPTAPV